MSCKTLIHVDTEVGLLKHTSRIKIYKLKGSYQSILRDHVQVHIRIKLAITVSKTEKRFESH